MKCGTRIWTILIKHSAVTLHYTTCRTWYFWSFAGACSLNWGTYCSFLWRSFVLFSSFSVAVLGSTFSCLLISLCCNLGLGISPSLIQDESCVSLVHWPVFFSNCQAQKWLKGIYSTSLTMECLQHAVPIHTHFPLHMRSLLSSTKPITSVGELTMNSVFCELDLRRHDT